MVQEMIDETFGRFKEVVAEGRGKAKENNKGDGKALTDDWRDLADGRILSGKQAFENGFVDELGNFDTAVKRAKSIASITDDPILVSYQRPFNFANLLRFFGKTDVSRIKIDLGLDAPRVQSGKLYFLSPTIFH
jgi:protease-4